MSWLSSGNMTKEQSQHEIEKVKAQLEIERFKDHLQNITCKEHIPALKCLGIQYHKKYGNLDNFKRDMIIKKRRSHR